MHAGSGTAPRFAQRLLLPGFLLLYALLSCYAMLIFLMGSDFGGQYAHTFTNMIDGTGERPMAYRMLMPLILRAVIALTPAGGIEAINALGVYARDSVPVRVVIESYRNDVPPTLLNEPLLHTTVLFVLLAWLCQLGYVALLYRLARRLYPASRAPALFAPVFALMLMPALHSQFAYPYDYSLLLLNTACLYALVLGNLRAYYGCFLLAVVNKETALYLPLLFAFSQWRTLPSRTLALHLLAQAALYLAITLGIRLETQGTVESGLFASKALHLRQMIKHAYNFDGYLAYFTAFFLLTFRWQEKPLLLRRGLWLLPIMTLAFFLLGYPREYRQFLDIAPIGVLLATHTLIVCTGIADSPLFRPERSA